MAPPGPSGTLARVVRSAVLACILATAACGGGSGRFAVVFDPCRPLAATPAADATPLEAAGVSAGLELWNVAAHTALAIGPEDGVPSVPVRFQKAAGAFFGLYDGDRGIVFINSGLTDGEALAVTGPTSSATASAWTTSAGTCGRRC